MKPVIIQARSAKVRVQAFLKTPPVRYAISSSWIGFNVRC
jgi:hypothetical protein